MGKRRIKKKPTSLTKVKKLIKTDAMFYLSKYGFVFLVLFYFNNTRCWQSSEAGAVILESNLAIFVINGLNNVHAL